MNEAPVLQKSKAEKHLNNGRIGGRITALITSLASAAKATLLNLKFFTLSMAHSQLSTLDPPR